MKFGKRLKKQIEESLPEWRSHFLNYKELKRRVNAVLSSASPGAAEAEFLTLLDAEIDKFNAFFLEREEEFVIRQRELQERIVQLQLQFHLQQRASSSSADAMARSLLGSIQREVVDFHGEMVLLLNYSSVNYTGLAKILKKFDKRRAGGAGGAAPPPLRLAVIARVLRQPFFTTDLISQLVRDCEAMMEAVFVPPASRDDLHERQALAAAEQSIFRNTVAALLSMQEVRSGSSTVGHFSLPPMQPLPESDWLISVNNTPTPSPLIIPTQ